MPTTEQLTFRDLLREPKRVSEVVDRERRLLIHRRGAPDLVVTRADLFEDELAGASGLGRLLRNLLAHVPPSEVGEVVADALPWTRFLSEEGRSELTAELGATLDACAELETFVALGQLLAAWKATAAAQADPELRARLAAPIEAVDGRSVPAP